MNILQQILSGLLQSLLTFFSQWVKDVQARTDEVNAQSFAKLVKATDERRITEHAIADAIKNAPIPTTPAAFNRKPPVLPLLMLALLPFTGCIRYIHVESPMPLIPVTTRPVLPEEPFTFTERESLLVEWGVKQEAAIETYNRRAEEHNRRSR